MGLRLADLRRDVLVMGTAVLVSLGLIFLLGLALMVYGLSEMSSPARVRRALRKESLEPQDPVETELSELYCSLDKLRLRRMHLESDDPEHETWEIYEGLLKKQIDVLAQRKKANEARALQKEIEERLGIEE